MCLFFVFILEMQSYLLCKSWHHCFLLSWWLRKFYSALINGLSETLSWFIQILRERYNWQPCYWFIIITLLLFVILCNTFNLFGFKFSFFVFVQSCHWHFCNCDGHSLSFLWCAIFCSSVMFAMVFAYYFRFCSAADIHCFSFLDGMTTDYKFGKGVRFNLQ